MYENKKDNAALALEGLGDWKRYGVQPLIVSKEEHSADVSLSVIYYALKRWHFDGETENGGEDQRVKSTVSLLIHVVPKGGWNINTTLASKMVSMLAAAGRQTLSRKLQNTILIDVLVEGTKPGDIFGEHSLVMCRPMQEHDGSVC
jgi:hypothetical protein